VQGIYQRHTTDFRATIIYTVEPVLATIMAVLLKQEVVGQTKVLAFFILFAGILLALEPNKNQMS
jgi:drug/metabolite transporter (DMT)-like permease